MKTVQELLSELQTSKVSKMTDVRLLQYDRARKFTRNDAEAIYSKYLEVGHLPQEELGIPVMTIRKLFKRYNLVYIDNKLKNQNKPQEFIDDLASLNVKEWCAKWDNANSMYFKLRKKHFPHLIDTSNYKAKDVRPKEFFEDVLTMSQRKWCAKWGSTRTTHRRIKKKLTDGFAISDLLP